MCSDRGTRRSRLWCLTAGTVFVLGGVGATACGHAVSENPPVAGSKNMNTAAQSVPGEYIITMQREGDAALVPELYAVYGVGDVKDLGRGRVLVKLEKDPGLAEVQRIAVASGKVKAVQPNFVYRGGGL